MRNWLKALLIGLCSLFMLAGCAIPGLSGGKNSTTDSNESVESIIDSNESDSSDDVAEEGYYVVKFDLCTTLKTNKVSSQEVEEGDVVVKPSVGVIGDNPDRMEIDSWYTDAEYTNEWNFTMDVVEENMTLYAKWVKKFAVTYYLGDEVDVPMYTRYVKEGSLIPYQPELSDGYESNGFFTTAMHKTPFDFNQPITEDVNVYIHRSEYIYFSGKMIADRFEMKAAMSGAGSTVGTIEYVDEGDGEGYAKLNFGYSTAADPHALLQNVTVDISASQKLEVTFKNLGKATSLKFYYLNWLPDGSYTDAPYFNEACAYTYHYNTDEMNMDPTDEWVTKVFDFSSILNNGVSNWGISATMISLRIQSGYISENPEDLSNEVWIKSIKGIPDDTYTSTEDSDRVAGMLQHDDSRDVENAANAQQDVLGWIFPKDYSLAAANGAQIYEKTNGLLFHSDFRAKEAGVSFTLDNEEINLDEKTTIRIRLTNYGYSNKIRLEYRNSYGFVKTKDLTISPCGDTPESKVYVLNMFGEDRYEANLSSLGFKYDSVGVDNAILIESIEFLDFKRIEIPGVNMNDKDAGVEGKDQFWTEVNGVSYAYNGGSMLDGGTDFTVNAGGYVATDVTMTNRGYQSITLKYKNAVGITKVYVALTINGQEMVYTYDVSKDVKQPTVNDEGIPVLEIEAGDVKANGDWREIFFPFNFELSGKVEHVKISFEGEGSITMQEIRFNMDKNSGVDFSDAAYTNYILARDWDGEIISYDNSYSAATISAWYKETVDSEGNVQANSGSLRYYFGAMYQGANKVGEGNIDISDKSKIIIVYNNQSDINKITVGIGLTDVREDESWKEDITQVFNETSGKVNTLEIEQGMAEGEWASVEIDLTMFNTLSDGTDGRAITEVLLHQTNPLSTESFMVRAIIVI